MVSVLVANNNRAEGERWRSQLTKSGYQVAGECLDLSAFVYALAREKVNFVICSISLIENNAFSILNAAMKFFPRIKIIIIGNMGDSIKSHILSNLTEVVVTGAFSTDLMKYCEIPVERDSDENPEQYLYPLLDGHFWTNSEAEMLFKRSMPKCNPDYVIISILSDSCFNQVYKVITETLSEMGQGLALQFLYNEVCVILDNSPSADLCFSTADLLRCALLKKTNVTFSIGISRSRSRAAELYACRREACRAASTSYLYGQNSVVHIEYLGENDIQYIYPTHKEKRLIEQTLDGNKGEALQLLDEIFQVLKSRMTLHQDLINKIALGILVKINIAASAKVKAFDKIQMDSMSLGKLLAAKTIDDTYFFLKTGIQDFSDEMDAFTDIRRDVLYLQLLKLKDEKTDISISDLTQSFHTTVNFLNSSVARNSGGNIFDFF